MKEKDLDRLADKVADRLKECMPYPVPVPVRVVPVPMPVPVPVPYYPEPYPWRPRPYDPWFPKIWYGTAAPSLEVKTTVANGPIRLSASGGASVPTVFLS